MIKEKLSLKVEKQDKDTFVIVKGIIKKEDVGSKKNSVLEKVAKNQKVDGFREGKAPGDLIEKQLNPMFIWQESAKEVIFDSFPEFLAEEGLVPMGTPSLEFTSVVQDGDVEFKISFSVLPKVELPDYKSIVSKLENPKDVGEATEKEIDGAILDIRKHLYQKANPEKKVPEDEKEIPELTEEQIKGFSTEYKTVDDLKGVIQEQIKKEKVMQAKSTFRNTILDSILKEVEINIPDIVIDEEEERAVEEMKAQATNLGTTIEDFYKEQNITEAAFRSKLREDAKKRAVTQMLLNAIAQKENIKPNEEEVKKEVDRFSARTKDVSREQVEMYISSILLNEAVLGKLESLVDTK